MRYLVAASLVWAFSFGLIKSHLGGVDAATVACARLALAAALFAPLLARRPLPRVISLAAMGLGAVQFGLMYVLYLAAYAWLPAWLVAVFTIFTPLYVVLLADLWERRLSWRHAVAAVLAVAGAGVIVWRGLPAGADWRGVVLLQGANLCFAAGQVAYPRLRRRAGGRDGALLGWMYLGATALALGAVGVRGGVDLEGWDRPAVLTVLYLGLLPTAAGFYLWNRGAALTSSGVLAVANNFKVPLAVLVSWSVFGEAADYGRALAGLAVMVAALFLAGRRPDPAVGTPTR